MSYSKKDIFHTQPPKQNFYLFLLKTRRGILKWYGTTTYLRQPSSSNNRLASKTSAKVFYTAY